MVFVPMAEPRETARKIPYLRATLADLYRAPQPDVCDACGEELGSASDAHEAPFAFPGKGVYMACRGDVVRYEDVPLCPSCGAAIGLSALRQWEIEEEEG
jgi:hypothetical protein